MRQLYKIIVTLSVAMLSSALAASAHDNQAGLSAENENSSDDKLQQEAKDAATGSEPNAQSRVKKKKGKRTSAKERKKKNLEVTTGFEYLNVPGVSGTVGLYLKPNILLEAGGFYGEFSLLNNGLSYMEGQGDIKFFMMNSLYMRIGCGYGQLVATHAPNLLNSSDKWSEGVALVHGFAAMGNQWQWRHFTMGIEWLNLGYSDQLNKVSNNIPVDTAGNPTITGDDAKSSLGAASGMTIGGKLYLGFSF